MKYYTIEIVTKDGATSQAIFERENIDVAKKEFHNTLSYNIGLEGIEKVLSGVVCVTSKGIEKVSVAVVNEELSILMKETWEAPVPEPTPEPTETVTEEV